LFTTFDHLIFTVSRCRRKILLPIQSQEFVTREARVALDAKDWKCRQCRTLCLIKEQPLMYQQAFSVVNHGSPQTLFALYGMLDHRGSLFRVKDILIMNTWRAA
jgi:hypothetical protein